MTYLVGLTGGIGCGKSTIANFFKELGAHIIDADEISHALTAPSGIAIEAIKQAFGNEFIDDLGAMHRAKMRELIFSDPDTKRQLENILHPLIYQQVLAKINQLQHTPYILLVIPLLIESPKYLALVQRIAVVDCDEPQQISRTMARSHLTEDTIHKIMACQISRTQRLQHADDVISNQNELVLTKAQVTALHAQYLKMRN
ncbi:dephospho-CoA kinase [Sulfuriferula nivalis]|uniref:Dephospho-CoA kinase n=1 Tax=Sulfuriferula nivalis TaxID=2675298 RepID=A0A809RKD7_9PROT|nr:dephospho-CoA kinase [Sulfuriferula nivalis]BBP02036.1 dephospho-CoA kinase [Sulfuriferula nivalis]